MIVPNHHNRFSSEQEEEEDLMLLNSHPSSQNHHRHHYHHYHRAHHHHHRQPMLVGNGGNINQASIVYPLKQIHLHPHHHNTGSQYGHHGQQHSLNHHDSRQDTNVYNYHHQNQHHEHHQPYHHLHSQNNNSYSNKQSHPVISQQVWGQYITPAASFSKQNRLGHSNQNRLQPHHLHHHILNIESHEQTQQQTVTHPLHQYPDYQQHQEQSQQVSLLPPPPPPKPHHQNDILPFQLSVVLHQQEQQHQHGQPTQASHQYSNRQHYYYHPYIAPQIYANVTDFLSNASSMFLPVYASQPYLNEPTSPNDDYYRPHPIHAWNSSFTLSDEEFENLLVIFSFCKTHNLPLLNLCSLSKQNNTFYVHDIYGYTYIQDQLLAVAQQKYTHEDFNSALKILETLCLFNRTHVPTLLLLGCTTYALRLYHLTLHYNASIITVDPNFAEAFSNLGTTFRSIAKSPQSEMVSLLMEYQHLLDTVGFENPVDGDDGNLSSEYLYSLSEKCYQHALSIKPLYWDAHMNLAGLLSSLNKLDEALKHYSHLETTYFPELARKIERMELDGSLHKDLMLVRALVETEDGTSMELKTMDPPAEKRIDIHFSKANLMLAKGSPLDAKKELFKGLAVAQVNILAVFEQARPDQPIPQPPIQPHSILVRHFQCPNYISLQRLVSLILQSLAKLYQDETFMYPTIYLYYISMMYYPSANTCNNLGIMLSAYRHDEAVQWYEFGLKLEPNHVHLYTNLGSALKDRGMTSESISCYQHAIAIQPDFFIALANLANVLKDIGRTEEAIEYYRRALKCKPDFMEAFCNYVNSVLFVCEWANRTENLQKVKEFVDNQLLETPMTVLPAVLPFHTFTYSSLSCWSVREISRRNAFKAIFNNKFAPWFPGFPERPVKLALKDNVTKEDLERSLLYPYPYPVPAPPNPHIRIGYVSSDFNNHPLSHLMQSVFGMHDKSKFRVYCYALSASDRSVHRQQIESESDVFIDVSMLSVDQIIQRIVADGIHILVNLNGYTKGGRNEIFAARPCPIQILFMGYANTLGGGDPHDPMNKDTFTETTTQYELVNEEGTLLLPSMPEFDELSKTWIDYMVVDEIVCPRYLTCKQKLSSNELEEAASHETDLRGPLDPNTDVNRLYTEKLIFMPDTFFVNDHRQGFRDLEDPEIDRLMSKYSLDSDILNTSSSTELQSIANAFTFTEIIKDRASWLKWRKEELTRLKMRRSMFPHLLEDTIIFANFNQLYKMDPEIFKVWLNILKRVPKSVLWLLRFPPVGEKNLRKTAIELAGEGVASRIIFTDVAPKHQHIHRGRIADMFLDTPECNAHTTAADILWSGTPILTWPKYDFKMCSRVAASVAYGSGTWSLGRSQPCYEGKIPGLYMNIPRLKKDNLVGHHMVVNSYQEYEERAVMLASNMSWSWKPLHPEPNKLIQTNPQDASSLFTEKQTHVTNPFFPSREIPDYIFTPDGLLVQLRQHLFLNRDHLPAFHTSLWVRNLEKGMLKAFDVWQRDWKQIQERNAIEISCVKFNLGMKDENTSKSSSVISSITEIASSKSSIINWKVEEVVTKKRNVMTERCYWV